MSVSRNNKGIWCESVRFKKLEVFDDDITDYNLTKKIEFEESEFKTIITLIDGLVEFFINK